MVKKLNQMEKREKSIKEAELELSTQKDIEEQDRETKRQRELFWVLNGGRYPN